MSGWVISPSEVLCCVLKDFLVWQGKRLGLPVFLCHSPKGLDVVSETNCNEL